jgi:hypothetical protein
LELCVSRELAGRTARGRRQRVGRERQCLSSEPCLVTTDVTYSFALPVTTDVAHGNVAANGNVAATSLQKEFESNGSQFAPSAPIEDAKLDTGRDAM